MSTTLPTATSYGSQVLTSGDLSVGSMSGRNKYAVYGTDPLRTDPQTNHFAYVTDTADGSVTESSRVVTETAGGKGIFSVGVLDAGKGEVVKSFKSAAEGTTIFAGDKKATFEQSGLSFDSDDCAIFFGKDKTFRIMYTEDKPARLVFQCVNPATGDYVTKFSCQKE